MRTNGAPPESRTLKLARIASWAGLGLYSAAIYYVSSIPGQDLPSFGFGLNDKVVHLKVYSLWGLICAAALHWTWPALYARWVLLIAFLCGTLYGASDELHQAFVPGRAAEFGDLLADGVGATIGAALYLLAAHLWRRRAMRSRPAGDKGRAATVACGTDALESKESKESNR